MRSVNSGFSLMELIQTDTQAIINRLYTQGPPILLPQLMICIISGSQASKETFWFVILTFLVIDIFIALWLCIFNSGKSKLHSFAVKVSDESISTYSFGDVKAIKKASYLGCRITGFYPKNIELLANTENNIRFSYFALNSNQRQELFDVLGSSKS